MILKKGLVLAAVLGLAGTATAEEKKVEATKTAPMVNLLPNFHSSVQFRHYSNISAAKQETTDGVSVEAQARLYVGSSFLDGDLDITAALRMKKVAQTDQVEKKSTNVGVSYSLYSNDIYSLGSYADLYFPTNGGATVGTLYLQNAVSTKISTAAGTLSLGAGFDFTADVSSRQSEVEVGNLPEKHSFSLKADDKVGQEANPLGMILAFNAGLKNVAQVKGLNIGYGSSMTQTHSPKMEVTTVDGEERISMTGYSVDRSSYDVYVISYALTDSVKLQNEFYHFHDKIYEQAASGDEYTSLFKVTKTL